MFKGGQLFGHQLIQLITLHMPHNTYRLHDARAPYLYDPRLQRLRVKKV